MGFILTTLLATALATRGAFSKNINIEWTNVDTSKLRAFTVEPGDKVKFNWSGRGHNLWKFPDRSTFENCNFENAIALADVGPHIISFGDEDADSAGWYGCSLGIHCQSRQKIKISVSGSGGDSTGTNTKVIPWTVPYRGPPSVTVDVGDAITFQWGSGHNVWRFGTKANFDSCQFPITQSTLLSDANAGPFTKRYGAADAGKTFWYGCRKAGHCPDQAQKLEVNVRQRGGSDQQPGTIIVGGFVNPNSLVYNLEWKIPYDDLFALQVRPGEKVVFNYQSGHNVWNFESKESFETCRFGRGGSRLLSRPDNRGPHSITFTDTDAGKTFWYGCQLGNHCSRNQRIKILVSGQSPGGAVGQVSASAATVSAGLVIISALGVA